MDVPKLPKEVYLGVGALAGVYCRDHDCHGAKSEGVIAISKKFGAKLQNCKPKTKAEEDYVRHFGKQFLKSTVIYQKSPKQHGY